MKTESLTHSRLLEVLRYDPQTGVFTHLRSTGRRKAGAVAGCSGQRGIKLVGIDGVMYKAHRLAWLYVHRAWPARVIDHINGDPSDNRMANLRDVSQTINLQNRRRAPKGSQSQLLGAHYLKTKKRWRAAIVVNGRSKHIGSYRTPELAHAAYVQAKRVLHPGGTL